MVETRFRGLAHALVATLGRKAAHDWHVHPYLRNLEHIMLRRRSAARRRTRLWARRRAPRCLLRRAGRTCVSLSACPRSYARMRTVEELAVLGLYVAQAVTKAAYEAKATPSTYKAGDRVVLHKAAANKLEPQEYRAAKRLELLGKVTTVTA